MCFSKSALGTSAGIIRCCSKSAICWTIISSSALRIGETVERIKIFRSFMAAFSKKSYFCRQKSIGEQSVDVQNLVMTFRASQPVDFFFLCLYRCYASVHLRYTFEMTSSRTFSSSLLFPIGIRIGLLSCAFMVLCC